MEVEGIGNPNPRFATSARLLSDSTSNLNRGLKIDDSFTVEGRFDLVLDLDAGDNYGIRLTDSGGGVTGSDLVQVVVRKDAAGNLEVALVELDGPTDTQRPRSRRSRSSRSLGENQIVLQVSATIPANAGRGASVVRSLGRRCAAQLRLQRDRPHLRHRNAGIPRDDEVWTRAEFRAAADGVMQNGVYGTLSVDANGKWNYELNNAAANVQALAQGEHDTDTFTVRVTDEHGATDTQTVTVDVTGSNDAPIITGGTSNGFVAEDTPAQTATGQLFAFDTDHNALLRWSAGPATVLGQFPGPLQIFGYTADFQFKLDRFTIERNNDGLIFDDTFSDGFAPPSAPNFANGTPANYLGSFGYVEANGELHLDGARSLALRGVGNPALTVGQLALLATNVDPNDLTRGLKSDDSFSVEGTFDLVLPGDGQAYGIGLTDTAIGVLPPDQLGEDNLALLVRRGAGGELLVQFNQLDTVADTSTTLAERVFVPLAGQNQITLRLVHDVANLGVVRAEFDLLGAGDPQTFGLSHTGHIFGTGTPGYAGDDENWTRAQIVAFGPDAYGQSTTYQGTYGSLTVAAERASGPTRSTTTPPPSRPCPGRYRDRQPTAACARCDLRARYRRVRHEQLPPGLHHRRRNQRHARHHRRSDDRPGVRRRWGAAGERAAQRVDVDQGAVALVDARLVRRLTALPRSTGYRALDLHARQQPVRHAAARPGRKRHRHLHGARERRARRFRRGQRTARHRRDRRHQRPAEPAAHPALSVGIRGRTRSRYRDLGVRLRQRQRAALVAEPRQHVRLFLALRVPRRELQHRRRTAASLFHDEFNAGGPPPSAPDFLAAAASGRQPGHELLSSAARSWRRRGKLVFRGSQTRSASAARASTP